MIDLAITSTIEQNHLIAPGTFLQECLRGTGLVKLDFIAACELVETLRIVVPPRTQLGGRGKIGAPLVESSVILLDPSRSHPINQYPVPLGRALLEVITNVHCAENRHVFHCVTRGLSLLLLFDEDGCQDDDDESDSHPISNLGVVLEGVNDGIAHSPAQSQIS